MKSSINTYHTLLKNTSLFLFFACTLPFLVISPAESNAQNSQAVSLAEDLFNSDEILDLTLSGDTRSLFNDRTGEPEYQRMEISYTAVEGQEIIIPLKVKTRGNFRRQRQNCFYPPLLLNFSKTKTPSNSLFGGQDKLKLVTPCRDQKYVIREYLVYKLYNLMTEKSFRARLVRVTYKDTKKGKTTDPLFGILLEDQDQLAIRNDSKIVKPKGLRPNKTSAEYFLPMAVFEYMIGNTDWSTQYRHNIKLLREEATVALIPVPYDYDHAGIVQAPYAQPAPALLLKSIRERRYRGYCIEDLSVFKPVIDRFNELKESFYQVYTDNPMLEDRYVRQTLQFLDDFYETINDPKDLKKAFSYPCLTNGTGNVVIMGLRGAKQK